MKMIKVTDEERKTILESHEFFEKQVMIQKKDNLTPLEEEDLLR